MPNYSRNLRAKTNQNLQDYMCSFIKDHTVILQCILYKMLCALLPFKAVEHLVVH